MKKGRKEKILKMNILVLGNGFDLAHNLPTKYIDFLEFARVIKDILTGTKVNKINWGSISTKIMKLINENVNYNNVCSTKSIRK